MNYHKLTIGYMVAVLAIGFACLLLAVVNLPIFKFDLYFLVLAGATVCFGSWATVKIPRVKTHIAVSDIFVFLTLLLYGGEIAIILAAFEAFVSSWRFCSKKLTILFNVAAMGFSTSVVVFALILGGLYADGRVILNNVNLRDLVVALSIIALTQFFVNTLLASVYDSLKNALPWWETWKSKYIWTFFTYFAGAVGAGALIKLAHYAGFGVIVATFPVILFVFLAYRMYLTNVEMSIGQAEQAEQYARVLEERSNALRESEERFRSAFAYAPIGIGLVSRQGKWLKVNHALCEILGYESDELLTMEFQSVMFAEDLGATLIKIHELMAGRIASCQMEQRYIHRTGRTVWTQWSVSASGDIKSDSSNLIFQLQDITDKKIAEQKLQHEATHDALTGLPNRALFMRRLEEALDRSRNDPKYQVSVLFIDLDRFKYVNDSLGHLIGDQLLIGIADRLRECMRPPDIVARLGGDEFMILVEGRYYSEKITRIAERIQRQFARPFDLYGQEVYSSASIGILRASENHMTSEDVMRDADTAMYQAKRSGRSQHAVFDEDMHAAARETLLLETDLRKAVEKYEFEVEYQPIFSLHSGEIEGVEALARWNHPTLGEILPSKFIPLAEETGLIDPLGELVLDKACTEIGDIYRAVDNESFKLSVNLSCRQFAQPFLVHQVKNILNRTGFPPSRLKLEITETVFFEYQERAIDMLNQLRELGINIDIDDFGTGYSNLSYLVRLPISTLKIDKIFVSPITDEGANTEIVRTIIAMAKNLNLKVIAEGIESQSQLDALKDLNCESGQGYLLARPMSATDLLAFLGGRGEDPIPAPAFDDISMVSMVQ
jgi:diguanylate cyclase (GGDEF)-like protein/PAS domain S-box-containing protein